jgi:hypothetical protein
MLPPPKKKKNTCIKADVEYALIIRIMFKPITITGRGTKLELT